MTKCLLVTAAVLVITCVSWRAARRHGGVGLACAIRARPDEGLFSGSLEARDEADVWVVRPDRVIALVEWDDEGHFRKGFAAVDRVRLHVDQWGQWASPEGRTLLGIALPVDAVGPWVRADGEILYRHRGDDPHGSPTDIGVMLVPTRTAFEQAKGREDLSETMRDLQHARATDENVLASRYRRTYRLVLPWSWVVAAGAALTAWVLVPPLKRVRRRRLGLCLACGYDLRGCRQSGRCSECGRACERVLTMGAA